MLLNQPERWENMWCSTVISRRCLKMKPDIFSQNSCTFQARLGCSVKLTAILVFPAIPILPNVRDSHSSKRTVVLPLWYMKPWDAISGHENGVFRVDFINAQVQLYPNTVVILSNITITTNDSIQFISYLFTFKRNNPETNCKVSTSKKKETTTKHKNYKTMQII
jgi:hypothetical protein